MRRAFSFEWVAAAFLAASVASPLGVGPGAASAADAKIDLTGCLAPSAEEGHTRVFDTSQGTTLTETVLDVEQWKGREGWTTTLEAQLGSHTPTVRETFVKPGRRLLLGDLSVGALRIKVGQPEHWVPLEAVPGRSYAPTCRARRCATARTSARRWSAADWEVVGFEPLTTPGGSYPDTIHIAASSAETECAAR